MDDSSFWVGEEVSGADVDALFFLSNGRVIGAVDWYDSEINGESTYKLYSGGDKFHVRQAIVDDVVTIEEVEHE